MNLQFKKRELEDFISEQVKAGRFPTPEDAVEAAVEQMMQDSQLQNIDDETAAAIHRAEAQIDRGEGIDFQKFAADWRKKLAAG